MKIILKYRRGPKPRGSWRYPLWFSLGIHYTYQEVAAWLPDWHHISYYALELTGTVSLTPKRNDTAMSWSDIRQITPMYDSQNTASYWNNQTRALKVRFPAVGEESSFTGTLYFGLHDDRDRFVAVLEEIRLAMSVDAEHWLRGNAADLGDGEETVQVTNLIKVQAPPMPWLADVVRRIRTTEDG